MIIAALLLLQALTLWLQYTSVVGQVNIPAPETLHAIFSVVSFPFSSFTGGLLSADCLLSIDTIGNLAFKRLVLQLTVVLGQHQQLSVHVGDVTGSPDSLLQSCSLSKHSVLAVGHDPQPHLFWRCIEKVLVMVSATGLVAGSRLQAGMMVMVYRSTPVQRVPPQPCHDGLWTNLRVSLYRSHCV